MGPGVDPKIASMSKSVGIFVNWVDIQHDYAPGFAKLLGPRIGEYQKLCPSEPFYDQPTVGTCTAFLVEPDVMVTASHCFGTSHRTPDPCRYNNIVFGFSYHTANGKDDPTVVPRENVYSCKKILKLDPDSDFAIFQLDRPVKDATPLQVRREGLVEGGAEVTVSGYPLGIPLKVASGGRVLSNLDKTYFLASLDAFGGNSGSAVFHSRTGLVEGILVGGTPDWKETDKGCLVSEVCADNGGSSCFGERVVRSTVFAPFLP